MHACICKAYLLMRSLHTANLMNLISVIIALSICTSVDRHGKAATQSALACLDMDDWLTAKLDGMCTIYVSAVANAYGQAEQVNAFPCARHHVCYSPKARQGLSHRCRRAHRSAIIARHCSEIRNTFQRVLACRLHKAECMVWSHVGRLVYNKLKLRPEHFAAKGLVRRVQAKS